MQTRLKIAVTLAATMGALPPPEAAAAEDGQRPSSYANVIEQDFAAVLARMKREKPGIQARQKSLLEARYDLADRPAGQGDRDVPREADPGRGARQASQGHDLGTPGRDVARDQDVFPAGFLPLPHPNHREGGMLFPKFVTDEVKKLDGRDLTRFDLDFDLPDHFLPEFPPAIFLTTRPDLGDVSKGNLVTLGNHYELFDGILNPKQIEGLRLLVTAFPQQQFNATHDRRSVEPSRGVSCLDCHVNGHTSAATHLAGDTRPQEFRHRIETPTLRGVNVQRLFGSQRALRSVEDFTEFEQRAAYFDGDPVIATKKGVNILERGSQVHFMAELQGRRTNTCVQLSLPSFQPPGQSCCAPSMSFRGVA